MICVSVIVPVYNCERYLAYCLESILTQTLKEIEIICIDDGSQDKSMEILQCIQRKDSRITILHQENKGSGPARNRGLDCAKGEYIAFLDADDYYINKYALESIYNTSVKQQVDICASLRCIERNNKIYKEDLFCKESEASAQGLMLHYENYQYDYYYQSYIYKRSFLNLNELRFPLLWRYQDPPFFVCAMFYAKEFYFIPIELYCYRWGHQNVKFSNIKTRDLLYGLKMNLEFSAKNNLYILHQTTLKRINSDFCETILAGVNADNLSLFDLLIQTNSCINKKMVGSGIYGLSENGLIFPLQKIIDAAHGKGASSGSEMAYKYKKKYLFPFELILHDSIIALYAAGNVGKQFFEQLSHSGYCKKIIWVDEQGDSIRKKEKIPVYNLDKLRRVSFDKLVIAVEREDVAEEIRKNLMSLGTDQLKIIWKNYRIR